MQGDNSVLNNFDFTAIDDLDPSLDGGYECKYEKEVPFELRIADPKSGPQEVGTLEAIRIKLLVLGGANNN